MDQHTPTEMRKHYVTVAPTEHGLVGLRFILAALGIICLGGAFIGVLLAL